MSVLTFNRGILHATVVYVSIHLMQSVAFSVNSCQQLEGYALYKLSTTTTTTYQSAGYAKPNRSSNKSTHLPWWTENSASKPLFSVLVDG